MTDSSPETQRQLRDSFSMFATGITIITATSVQGELFGVTVNSFSSLSLSPPLIQWGLQKNSDTLEDFNAAQNYIVHVLAEGAMELSNRYAKKGDHLLRASDYQLDQHGEVKLNQTIASYHCSAYATYDGGDHIIMLGEVSRWDSQPQASPLLFFGGKYHNLGVSL